VHVVVEAAVVEMVNVAVPAAVPVMETGVVAPKLSVGRFTAPVGLEVTAAVNATLPVNPKLGVTVTVEALPVVVPGETETAVAGVLRLKIGSKKSERPGDVVSVRPPPVPVTTMLQQSPGDTVKGTLIVMSEDPPAAIVLGLKLTIVPAG